LIPDGVLLVDKPAGVTSHDVVAAERRRRASADEVGRGDEAAGRGRGLKVGHAGTLDPFATGLLLVLVGRATRAQRFLMALPKRYETVARLGWTSTTGDTEGEIAPGRMPAEPQVLATGPRSRSSAARAPTSARSSPTSATPTASSCGAPGSASSTSPTPTRNDSCRWTTRSASCRRST
jgi:tRNA pseudouridine55 synthase